MHELQLKQAGRQAKEYAAAKDRQTLEVLKRCIDYLAGAGFLLYNGISRLTLTARLGVHYQPHCFR